MQRWLLFWAILALCAALGPGDSLYLGMALGGFTAIWGGVRYCDGQLEGATRLLAIASAGVGGLAVVLSMLRFGLAWWAVGHLGDRLA